MPTEVEVYKGFQLTVVPLPNGTFCVEITPTGGTDRSVRTQAHREASGAIASARLTIDRGVIDNDRGPLDLG